MLELPILPARAPAVSYLSYLPSACGQCSVGYGINPWKAQCRRTVISGHVARAAASSASHLRCAVCLACVWYGDRGELGGRGGGYSAYSCAFRHGVACGFLGHCSPT